MGLSLVHGLASTPRLEKAMTQTMGNLGRMRPRASKRDFFEPRGRNAPPLQKSAQRRVPFAGAAAQDQSAIPCTRLVLRRSAPNKPRSKTNAVEMTRGGKPG